PDFLFPLPSRNHPIQNRLGDGAFGQQREVFVVAVAAQEGDAVGAVAEARALLVQVVQHDPVEVFLFELAPGIGEAVVGLHRKAHQNLPVVLVLAERGEDVGRAAQTQRQVAFFFFDLGGGGFDGRVVGDGGDHEHEVGRGVLLHGSVHLLGGRHIDAGDACGRGEGGGAADERDLGTACARGG